MSSQASPKDSPKKSSPERLEITSLSRMCVSCGKTVAWDVTNAFKEKGVITVEASCRTCKSSIVDTITEEVAKEVLR